MGDTSYVKGGGGASLPTTPAAALLDAAHQGEVLLLAPSTGVGTSLPIEDVVGTGIGILTESDDEGDFVVGDGAGASQLASVDPAAVRAVIGAGGTAREGTLAARGTASDYQGGTYLVTSGASSLWSLWQSVLVSGTWTWVQRVYRVPTDTITSSGMLADWDFSALTRSSTTVTNAISPGTGDLSIGSTLQGRLQWSTVDPTTWQGLQALPITAAADPSPSSNLDLSTGAGAPFKPSGDWTVALWVARNNAAGYSPVGSLFAIGSRIDASTWGSPSNFFAVEVGVDSNFRPYGGVHHGGGPTYTGITATDPLTNGRLTLLTLTYVASSGTLTLYVDTLAAATATGLGAIYWGTATNRPWCIAGNINSTGVIAQQQWPGWIGRVMVSNAAASSADVVRHYGLLAERM